MRHLPLVCVATLAALAACADSGHDDPNAQLPADPTISCKQAETAPAPLSRLNSREYRNTVSDLFGVDGSASLPADNVPANFGYDNSVHNASVSQLRADALFASATTIGESMAQQLDTLLPCDTSAVDGACIDTFIDTLGRRIYRRPLDEVEHAALRKIDDDAVARGDALQVRIELIVQAMSFAPQFIYRAEIGETATEAAAPGLVALSDHEVATRLAYLLWASSPDVALLDVAAAGGLSEREDIASEARRMLDDPRARRGAANFMMQWIDVRDLEQLSRDAQKYGNFNPALASSMAEELRRFFERVVFEKNGSIADLLRARETVIDQALATLYGVQHPGGEDWATVALPEGERRGVLTLAGFLTDKAHPIQPAPVQRGKFIRTRLLCQPVPDPPDDVDTSVDPTQDAQTNRELLEQHSSDPSCAGCHQYMDPIGFGLESFDSIGQYRTTDNGQPVDASGELIDAGEVSGPFVGAIELSDRLAESEEVRACMTRQVFRYATGRTEENQDICSLQQIEQSDLEHDGSIRELLVAIASSDGFRFRREEK